MSTPAYTHIHTSGGLISAASIENIHEPGSRQRGVEPESFALPWSEPPKSLAAMKDTIAAAWELLSVCSRLQCVSGSLSCGGRMRHSGRSTGRSGWFWKRLKNTDFSDKRII
jgi:hypothetical protein